MVVAVIGSRTFNNRQLVFNKLATVNDFISITEIVSGGANGPDTYGEQWGDVNNIKKTIFKPDWDKYGKGAGFIRNKDIVLSANLVMAFYDGVSKGTKHSLELCKKHFINFITINPNGSVNHELTNIYRDYRKPYSFARRVRNGESYYEVSSKGHLEYSALYAKVNGVSIEELYQLDIKGYRGIFKHWKEAKGKPPTYEISSKDLYSKYRNLWIQYFLEHPKLYLKVLSEAKEKTITDMFGTTPINQARAICDLCNNGLR